MELSLLVRKMLVIAFWQVGTPFIVLFIGWLRNTDEEESEKLTLKITGWYYVQIVGGFVFKYLCKFYLIVFAPIFNWIYKRYPRTVEAIFIIIIILAYLWLNSEVGSSPPDDVNQYEDGYR